MSVLVVGRHKFEHLVDVVDSHGGSDAGKGRLGSRLLAADLAVNNTADDHSNDIRQAISECTYV